MRAILLAALLAFSSLSEAQWPNWTTRSPYSGGSFTGTLLAPDGTNSAPAWSFAADPTLGMYRAGTNTLQIAIAGNNRVRFTNNENGVQVGSALGFSWSASPTSTSTSDLILVRDAAGTLAQRNTTNAQAFRVYNTFTDSSNNEYGSLGWSGNVWTIGTVANGTGSGRSLTLNAAGAGVLTLQTGGTNRWRVDANGALLGFTATGGLGYTTGAGGTVTQLTSKSTAVTLNTVTGQITMNNAALAAAAEVCFTVNNSAVAATDVVVLSVSGGIASAGTYIPFVNNTGAGTFGACVSNVSAGSLSEAVVLNFVVIKGAAS